MIIKILAALYILINTGTFLLYGADKKKARTSKRRIKESTLLLSAFLFGGIGAFAGMRFFHHKTRHRNFVILVPAAAVLNIAAISLILLLK